MTVLPFTDLTRLEDVLPKLGDVSAKSNGTELVSACPVCGSSRRFKVVRRNDYLAEALAPECGCDLGEVATALGLPSDYFAKGNGFRIEELPDLGSIEDEMPIVWRVERAIFGSDFDRASLVLRHTRLTNRDVVYTKKEAGWLLWAGSIWSVVGDEEIRALVAEVGDRIKREANEVSSEAIQVAEKNELLAEQLRKEAERLYAAAKAFRTAKVIDNIVSSMRSLPGVGIAKERGEAAPSINDFDSDPDIIGFKNGVVDLRTGELRPYRREDRITKRVDYRYDPSATCPRFETFMREIFVDGDGVTDEEVVSFVHRLIGYGITGHTKEEIFAVLWGSGSNGKSKLLEALDTVFKAYTVATPFETFEERKSGTAAYEFAELKGARLVIASEGNANAPMAEAAIKRLTGRDSFPARRIYGSPFTFYPSFLVLLATNAKPRFVGQEEGLWRRIKLIPFRRFFSPDERDPDLSEKLKAEAEGIAAWAVRGAQAWYAQGLGSASSIERETRAYRDESDRLGDFLSAHVEITGNEADRVSNKDLYNRYREWARDLGEDRPLHSTTFGQMIGSRPGVGRYRGKAERGFSGLKLYTDREITQRQNEDRRINAVSPAEVWGR